MVFLLYLILNDSNVRSNVMEIWQEVWDVGDEYLLP